MRLFARLAALLLLLWGGGFAYYLEDAERRVADSVRLAGALALPESAKNEAAETAIIVLTGGSERIATGLKLLQEGYGAKLFISGIGPGADYARIFAGLPRDRALEACCIALGRQADDTVGNASESIEWLGAQKLHRIILVTAHYHMLRSLLEFRMLTPALAVQPYAVKPARVPVDEWWQRPGTARLLMLEYNKLLFTLVRYELRALL